MALWVSRLLLPLALLLCELAILEKSGSGVGTESVAGRGAPGSASPPALRRCCSGPRVERIPDVAADS